MSEMYTARVINRGALWVDIELTQCHSDYRGFPETKGFALQLILATAYDEGYEHVPVGPLGEAVAFGDSYDVEMCDERANEFIESMRVYRAENVRFDGAVAHAKTDAKVIARGIALDSDEWGSAWTNEWRAYWKSQDGPPRVTLRILATDARWIEHLQPGDTFDGAGYSDEGPWVEANRAERMLLPPDAFVPERLVDFPLAHIPRSSTSINHELIGQLTGVEPFPAAELASAVVAHGAFLESGGRDGEWNIVHTMGVTFCVYAGAEATEGAQLVLRLLRLVENASLEGALLEHADFSTAICTGANFKKANLNGSVAVDSVFDGADFTGASLADVDFSRSSLKGASLAGANLDGADFENADLTGADFTGANVQRARFPGATLDNIKR